MAIDGCGAAAAGTEAGGTVRAVRAVTAVKLLDFGIAKVVAGEGPGVDLAHATSATLTGTHPGRSLGPPAT
jgi:hypothetical protein